MIILNFTKRLNENNRVLNFGDEKPNRTFILKLKLKKQGQIAVRAHLALTHHVRLSYHANVFRGLMADVCDTMQTTTRQAHAHEQAWQVVARLDNLTCQQWGVGRQVRCMSCQSIDSLNMNAVGACHVAGVGRRYTHFVCDDFANLSFVGGVLCHRSDVAVMMGRYAFDEYFNLPTVAIGRCHQKQVARYAHISHCHMVMGAYQADVGTCERLQTAQIPPVMSLVVVIDDDNGQTIHTLNFSCLWDEHNRILEFADVCQGNKDGVIVIVNDVSLLIDGKEMDCFGLSVAINNQSYAWQMTAKIARHHLADVNIFDGFKEAIVKINGYKWRFLVDNVADNLAFGSQSLDIKGKSRSCLLAEPFHGTRSHLSDKAVTAIQLANDELNRDNKPSDFSLDWQMTDWLIPKYSYMDKTPIQALTWLAETAGGFINTHPFDDVIIAKQNYPMARWELAPSVSIDNRLILDMSTERLQTPDYNGVYVSGMQAGVSMLIKRQGTSGGYRGAMITHELITDDTVARVRGIHELSSVGDRVNVSLNMPMHADLGLLMPSDVVAVGGMVGVVRSISISVNVGGRGEITIRQNVAVEI
ncbi:hypothetical protein [Moraxella bovis]|uniref:Uncharacterized protein n=1 Tax=Moraxella bovis TaxID=476 RepID=A0A378PXV3_MORBO|nr:hypothetical protein [Moraxella bovis]STY93443.1 Uncharacterised protein [Moraxella bovis]